MQKKCMIYMVELRRTLDFTDSTDLSRSNHIWESVHTVDFTDSANLSRSNHIWESVHSYKNTNRKTNSMVTWFLDYNAYSVACFNEFVVLYKYHSSIVQIFLPYTQPEVSKTLFLVDKFFNWDRIPISYLILMLLMRGYSL